MTEAPPARGPSHYLAVPVSSHVDLSTPNVRCPTEHRDPDRWPSARPRRSPYCYRMGQIRGFLNGIRNFLRRGPLETGWRPGPEALGTRFPIADDRVSLTRIDFEESQCLHRQEPPGTRQITGEIETVASLRGSLESRPTPARRASFEVALLFPAPQGPQQISPGQRPGNPGTIPIGKALKGRNKQRLKAAIARSETPRRTPAMERKVRPFQGMGHHVFQIPGRCPGLICCGPFGAKSNMRNFKTRQRGRFTVPQATGLFSHTRAHGYTRRITRLGLSDSGSEVAATVHQS
jgi:hypothetical protein